MKKVFLIIYSVIATVVLLKIAWLIIISSGPFESGLFYPNTIGSYSDSNSFSIDPETILTDLDSGNQDVFTLFSTESQIPLSDQSPTWTQRDYLKIASALHFFVWKEDLALQNFERIVFDSDCEHPGKLPYADFYIYTTILSQDKLMYNSREINISPKDKYVSWGGNTYFPRPILGWNRIDLEKLQITYEEAIALAEDSGGRGARLRAANKCSIMSILTDTWRITYLMDDISLDDLELQLNPYNGKVLVK